jgi:hypothetical protein
MDDVIIPARDDPQYQYVLAQYGGPAFMRRAQRAQAALADLLQRLQQTRQQWLDMVRLRLGQLHALAGGWQRLARLIDAASLTALRELFDELQPSLRTPLEMTDHDATLRAALAELQASMDRFNQRWRGLLLQTDLAEVNRRRDEYNRWYVFEKECFVRSPHIARQGFRPLPMVASVDLERWFPLLSPVISHQ